MSKIIQLFPSKTKRSVLDNPFVQGRNASDKIVTVQVRNGKLITVKPELS